MKLPATKKERAQILVLLGIGGLAIFYALVQLAAKPLWSYRAKLVEERARIQEKMDKASQDLRKMALLERERDELAAELNTMSSNYVLQPILGSYFVAVNDSLERLARTQGIRLKTGAIKEVGLLEIPGKNKDRSPRIFRPYSLRLEGVATFAALCAFLERLEQDNPLLCVTEIQVTGQPEDPEHHRVSLRLEWPVRQEPEKAAGPEPAPKGKP